MNQIITVQRTLPEEFLSDIMITAFDGQYGWSWHWFEPVGGDWLQIKKVPRGGPQENDNHEYWMSARVRVKADYPTGDKILDRRDGFVIDHEGLARGIQCIIDDTYRGIWKRASVRETAQILDKYGSKMFGSNISEGDLYGRRFRAAGTKTFGYYEMETGETARGYQQALTTIVAGLESETTDAGDIDAPFADAIVQVAAFGKCIFS